MTEWVGQRKKRCDVCNIFISNNSPIIKIHEQSLRHRENVKKLSNMTEKKDAKEKDKKKTTRVLKQVEEKASHSYQNDISTLKARDSDATSLAAQTSREGIGDQFTMYGEWEYDTSAGYFYNQTNGCYYDPKSGFFYTNALGKWATLKEVLAAATKLSSQKKPNLATSKSPFQNGQHEKDNVTKSKKPSNMVEKKVAKKKTSRVLTLAQIEEKESNATSLAAQTSSEGIGDCGCHLSTMFGEKTCYPIDLMRMLDDHDWEHDNSYGYYYNQTNGCYYDPKSGLYYPHDLGKWVTLKEALAATPKLASKSQPSSSVHIKKRKQPDSKPKLVSEEEEAAIKACEVERKRVEEREKFGKLPIRFTYTRKKRKD
ncbi:unnamed protein product [Lactuca virosa]|uniref:Matrin-type domain-containing protein n=1 Tax=Lactuca virosa TaxID=75947 RepID=A0AAU9MDR8_9ASTR|nr:unnamed protein product [Lactuca virosa]